MAKKVNIADAVQVMLNYNKGKTKYSPEELSMNMGYILHSDVNHDGKVDSTDAEKIRIKIKNPTMSDEAVLNYTGN